MDGSGMRSMRTGRRLDGREYSMMFKWCLGVGGWGYLGISFLGGTCFFLGKEGCSMISR